MGAVRAGLSLAFKGKVLIMVLLVVIPQIIEAIVVAMLTIKLFDFPIAAAFAMGFALAASSPGMLVPPMIKF